MNVYHLELFYHVAKHGGISAAVREMTSGIGQPAVSGQMGKLEEDAGAKLFERTPFKLTAAGEELFAHVRPFFEALPGLARELRETEAPRLRVGAAEMVIREHLHPVIEAVRARFPRMQLGLRSGFSPELQQWLREREIDVAIAPLDGKLAPHIRSVRVMRVPMVLLVPAASPIKSAQELWARGTIDEPLVTVPANEAMSRLFFAELKRRRVKWKPTIEASSLELVTRYVERGYGLGVNVGMREVVGSHGVRVLPLEGFAPVEMAIFWHGEATPMILLLVEECGRYVKEFFPQWQCVDSIV
ncbi:MAG: HTH-type transcriptional regulator BenM [Verrucomicrobiota bacterium]|jgi:DNA-binding transcriptional LysR family regulator